MPLLGFDLNVKTHKLNLSEKRGLLLTIYKQSLIKECLCCKQNSARNFKLLIQFNWDKVKKPSFKNEFIQCQIGISSIKRRNREAKSDKCHLTEWARAQIKRRRHVSDPLLYELKCIQNVYFIEFKAFIVFNCLILYFNLTESRNKCKIELFELKYRQSLIKCNEIMVSVCLFIDFF